MKAAQEIIKMHANWGPGASAPGAILTLKEASREGGQVSYRLYAEGLPRDRTYAVIQWPVTMQKPAVLLQGVTFDGSGLAICAGRPGKCGRPEIPDDPIDFKFRPVEGEPIRLAVAATDAPALRAFVKMVPTPIAAQDQGCRLEGVLLMPHGEIVFVEASGFPVDADLAMRSDSEGEVKEGKAKANGRGEWNTSILPAKAGLKSGKIRIRVSGPKCSPEISVPWGVQGK
jgi:hypothetical protein